MSNKQIEGLLITHLLCSISSCISSDDDHDDNSSIFFTRRSFITIPRDITTVIMTHRMWIPEFLAVYSETEDAAASAGTSPLAQSRTQLFTCFGEKIGVRLRRTGLMERYSLFPRAPALFNLTTIFSQPQNTSIAPGYECALSPLQLVCTKIFLRSPII